MAYIGRDTDKISNVEVLDNITFDGSSSYTLQKGGSNFTPSSANTLLVSINGVVQAGNFTVSGSTIDFGTAVAGTSTCNFILHYGVGLITTPSDGTVTTAKLADSSVSLAKLTATGTKDATTFLRGDNTFAEAGGGKVLQVVNATTTTETVNSTNTYTDTGITATITPSSTTSKILVHVCAAGVGKANNNTWVQLKLLRNTTDLIVFEQRGGYTADTSANKVGTCACTYLDSPSTTSATTYKVQMMSGGNSNYAQVGDSYPSSTITLTEISA